MNSSPGTKGAAVAAATCLFGSLLLAGPAFARPEPQPTPTAASIDRSTCALTRLGTQYVRCDDLTGAGVPAPDWIPESYSVVDDGLLVRHSALLMKRIVRL